MTKRAFAVTRPDASMEEHKMTTTANRYRINEHRAMTEPRYAAQAVTVDGYGDPVIIVQPVGEEPNDGPTGEPIAEITIDGDFTAAADLDHALAGRNLRRIGDWEPCDFGAIATVTNAIAASGERGED